MCPEPSAQTSLCAEILADARRSAQQMVLRANREAERRRAQAAADVAAWRSAELARARVEADRRRALALAALPLERRRRWLARVELLLEAIHTSARAELGKMEAPDLLPVIVGLALEAARQLDGVGLRVALSVQEHASMGVDLERALRAQLGRPSQEIEVVAVPAQRGPGPIVEERTGRRRWDNRLLSRLGRLWPELRRELATQLFAAARRGEP